MFSKSKPEKEKKKEELIFISKKNNHEWEIGTIDIYNICMNKSFGSNV